tara:strand:- start:340963 stop:341601 length:639 start_codon:yes stop_codon:yes gene_type:complete
MECEKLTQILIDTRQDIGYFWPMGLLYQFPVEENPQDDRIQIQENKLTIRNYGLPLIFWGYLLAILAVIFIMFLVIKGPALKLAATDDTINKLLGNGVLAFLAVLPISVLAFYFFDKAIIKNGDQLILKYSVFWIPVWKKRILLKAKDSLELNHFIDSPNVAKIENKTDMAGFQNRGYHELFAVDTNGKRILIDRNSRKGEVRKLKELLEKY